MAWSTGGKTAAVGATPAECVWVNDDAQCSEISSKMNVVGIMTAISGFNCIVTIVSIVSDLQGCRVPVKNLTRIFFAWSIVPITLAVAVIVMAMVNPQCTSTQSLADQEGSYGPGFQMISASFFGMFVSLIIHTCAMYLIGNVQQPNTNNDDEEDELNA